MVALTKVLTPGRTCPLPYSSSSTCSLFVDLRSALNVWESAWTKYPEKAHLHFSGNCVIFLALSGEIFALVLLKAVSSLSGALAPWQRQGVFCNDLGQGVPYTVQGVAVRLQAWGAEPVDQAPYTWLPKKDMLALLSRSPSSGAGYSLWSGPVSPRLNSATLLTEDLFHVVPEAGSSQALAVPLPATQPSCSLQPDLWCWANRQLPKELVSRVAVLQEQLRENWIFYLNTHEFLAAR